MDPYSKRSNPVGFGTFVLVESVAGYDLFCSVADPDPGFGAFLTPGSGIRDG